MKPFIFLVFSIYVAFLSWGELTGMFGNIWSLVICWLFISVPSSIFVGTAIYSLSGVPLEASDAPEEI